ncbi:hypothetical protein MTR67_051839 [Solanum verrucosum]|uniref:Tf2-1-like SH3-like domain-containing protein n=1 Tax=Solanum verrucosum TaxID=315347 RepID=A0AAF0V7B6_SOLVR|nr:hypothetical protein MTR67_051839 [Solanum verrucosum]
MKGVMRFGKKGKLSPRYIGPYRIAKRIEKIAYELELPQELAAVHPVFHVFMLKNCMGDPSLVIPTKDIGIKDSLSYDEIHVQILDRQVRKLRTKELASVKVLWRNQFVEEATWKAEEDMKKRYPHIFESGEVPNQGLVAFVYIELMLETLVARPIQRLESIVFSCGPEWYGWGCWLPFPGTVLVTAGNVELGMKKRKKGNP